VATPFDVHYFEIKHNNARDTVTATGRHVIPGKIARMIEVMEVVAAPGFHIISEGVKLSHGFFVPGDVFGIGYGDVISPDKDKISEQVRKHAGALVQDGRLIATHRSSGSDRSAVGFSDARPAGDAVGRRGTLAT